MRRISVMGMCKMFLALVASFNVSDTENEGKYTNNIEGCQVLVPRKKDQDGSFLS